MKQIDFQEIIKFLTFLSLFLTMSCSTKYFVETKGVRIISNEKDVMYYTNDTYNFFSEISIEQDSNNIDTVVNQRAKRILQLADFNNKRDTVLFAGRSDIFVLKNRIKNSEKFRIINLYDTILSILPFDYWKVNFYRQIIIDKKHKTYIINDLIPYKNKYLQKIQFNETNYNTFTDPTDLNSIVSYYLFYKETIPQTKETYLSFLENKKIPIQNPIELFDKYFLKDTLFNYRAAYIALNKAYNYYTPESKGFFDQILATYYSFAGDIARSDSVWKQLAQTKDTCDCLQTGDISDLLKIITRNQVVMFNEAHHVPKHRLFVSNLLDTLYNQGFRYLALEAFTGDSLFYQTGFLSADNGFYLREPNFANLVRKAYKLGFKVFGYDDMSAMRDSIQAVNIFNQTIKKDVTAKVVVLAGWGHIDRNAMAGKFEKISGIKPLTIDQTIGYNFCNKNNKINTTHIFKPSSNMRGVKADLYLFNNLDLHLAGKTNITIPDDIKDFCSIICIYDEKEFEWIRSKNKIPIPVAIINPNETNELNGNLPTGEYIVVFQDDYGTILDKKRLSVNN